MAESIREVMTTDPHTVDTGTSLQEAAQAMRDRDVGALIVTEQDTVTAIVTDRDIVIRGVAEGTDPSSGTVGDVCSGELTTLSPQDSVEDAIKTMRDQDVRRLPVVDDGKAVGVVSLGDLAIDRDPESVLADISSEPPPD
jgi:CBS domain-containing protein